MKHCPHCGAELDPPALTSTRTPAGMGVIWSERHAAPIVYQLHVAGDIESARLLAGEFLELDEPLKAAIARDLARGSHKG